MIDIRIAIDRCGNCGLIVLRGECYCFGCGIRLEQFCTHCHRTQSHPIANYCPFCGTPTTGSNTPFSFSPTSGSPE